MQFKRPKNTNTPDGVPVKVNSFQFLRSSKLILSVKASELVNGWEIPAEVLARAKGDPLTEEELAEWKAWKAKHDRTELIETNIARFRAAQASVLEVVSDNIMAIDHKLVSLTEADAAEQWELIDDWASALKKAGFERPKRPRGRPKAKRVIYDDGGGVQWLPNFFPPDSEDFARYEALLAEQGKPPGDEA